MKVGRLDVAQGASYNRDSSTSQNRVLAIFLDVLSFEQKLIYVYSLFDFCSKNKSIDEDISYGSLSQRMLFSDIRAILFI